MQLKYTVLTAHRGPVRVPTEHGEAKQAYTPDGLVVEVRSGDMTHSIQIADHLAEAEALFKPGAELVFTIAPAPADEADEAE